jgi:hypothetical protein
MIRRHIARHFGTTGKEEIIDDIENDGRAVMMSYDNTVMDGLVE